MRSIPNSGYYLILFYYNRCVLCLCCVHSFVCLHCAEPKMSVLFILGECCISHKSSVYVKSCVDLSVCLSVSPVSVPLGSIPGYFPTRMSYPWWEHVSLLPPLTPSSSHTGCLMAPSTTCCMKAPVSTSALVTNSVLVTGFGGLLWFVIFCILVFVIMLPSLSAQ